MGKTDLPVVHARLEEDWQCKVGSAHPTQSGNALRAGGPTRYIVLNTKNRGRITVGGETVSVDNAEQVAASFEPGSEWIFEISWYSRNIGMPIERGSPSSQEYHQLAE